VFGPNRYKNITHGKTTPLIMDQFGGMGPAMHKLLDTFAELQTARALEKTFMQVQYHPAYRRVKSAAHNHVYMVISVALAREQARLVIKGAESCERRWGNQPGNLPVGVAPVGLVGVVAGASVDSMGLLPQQ
jgi:hypothetical protein